jgi:hypothetical protein
VFVPLANDRGAAVLDKVDYDRLTSLGISDQWHARATRPRYVQCWAGGKTLVVARLIANAVTGEVVRYRDRDGLNLRASNLLLKRRV